MKRPNLPSKQLGFIGAKRLLLGSNWTPDRWFRSGEPGDYWHLANLDGIYQESTGVTPAAVGQAVGSMLGRRYGGARGVELVANGTFADATGWTVPAGWAVGSGVATATATSNSLRYTGISAAVGKVYLVEFDWTHTSGTLYSAVGLGAAASFTTSGHKTVRLTCGATAANGVEFYGGAVTGVLDNVSIREIPGIHRIQSTAINRPILRQSATGLYYLEYNGTNQWMQTASTVDLTSTDKVTLVTGVRKESDAADGLIVEFGSLSGSVNGTFQLKAPGSGMATKFQYASRGTTTVVPNTSAAAYIAPITAVVTGISNISAPLASLRLNGAVIQDVTTSQGTGNFSNSTMYFGAQQGTSLFANMREYATILRGAASTLADIQRTEKWMNARTGAY